MDHWLEALKIIGALVVGGLFRPGWKVLGTWLGIKKKESELEDQKYINARYQRLVTLFEQRLAKYMTLADKLQEDYLLVRAENSRKMLEIEYLKRENNQLRGGETKL